MSDLPIPEAALDKHIAFLGATGSGKTSADKAAVIEPVLEANGRALIIDPKGDWWGLRLSKSGKREGYPIPIFGGRHADYPLRVKDAAALAEAYGTSHGSAVFDTSLMSVEDRAQWFINFAEALMRKNRGRVHVVLDECHIFAPKAGAKIHGLAPRMLHAANNLASLGRGLGLRISMLSQRPAKVHNDLLSCAKTMVAMQMVLPHDRDAVRDWIVDQADPSVGKEIVASLPSLKPGEAWVWYPLGGYLKRKRFPLPQTFDASAAPSDDPGEGPTLAPINLDKLQGKLASIEEERKANDPAALKKRVADLEGEVRRLETAAPVAPAKPDKDALAEAQRLGFAQAERKLAAAMRRELARKLKEGLAAMRRHAAGAIERIDHELRKIDAKDVALAAAYEPPAAQPAPARPPARANGPAPSPARAPVARPASPRSEAEAGNGAIPQGERAVLTAIAMYPDGAERELVGVLSGYKRSTRDRYIQSVTGKGYAEIRGNDLFATQDGIDALGDFTPLPTGRALQEYWLQRLPEGERRILGCLIESYPNAVERDPLGEAVAYKRSTRDRYLQTLATRKLVTAERGMVRAADILFEA
jgi:hypothetical protein